MLSTPVSETLTSSVWPSRARGLLICSVPPVTVVTPTMGLAAPRTSMPEVTLRLPEPSSEPLRTCVPAPLIATLSGP